jgi:hypothetical protein
LSSTTTPLHSVDDRGSPFVPRREDTREAVFLRFSRRDESELIGDEERDATESLLEAREGERERASRTSV